MKCWRLEDEHSLSLWERAGVRAAAVRKQAAVQTATPLALTPTLSQRERELNKTFALLALKNMSM
jgi:hypothetical protein